MERENNSQEWDKYWEESNSNSLLVRVYSKIASFYRNFLIGPRLKFEINKYFEKKSSLLHAGSGAGEVDQLLKDDFKITALDLSPLALKKYSQRNTNACCIIGDITDLSNIKNKFDGVYNLGVMEHLTPEQIKKSLKEFSNVLNKKGKIILFWPPSYGFSVVFLHVVHFVLNKILKKNILLHPMEPNKVDFRKNFLHYIEGTDLKLINFKISPRDFFTYLVVVLEKN